MTLSEHLATEAKDYLNKVLVHTFGNVSAAAKIAGRNRTEFYRLLQRHKIDPKTYRLP